MALAPGTRIGTYEILATLGAGGMGEVYRARDVRLGRDVAIKLMLESVATDPEHLARFEREAQTLASLNHPNIAQIYGIEEGGGGLALIMEMVEGPTLLDRITTGTISIEQAIYIALQLSAALEYAHEHHVIHRDLKPANIKLRHDFTLKVLDFGLAKRTAQRGPRDETAKFATALTMPGTVFGTPGYMAPELLRGGLADFRTDIFAFGVVLFELLTRRHPFQRPSIFEIAEAILNPNPPVWPEATQSIPDYLQYLVNKAIAKDPAERYQTITELRIDLSACLAMTNPTPQPPPVALPGSAAHRLGSGVQAPPRPSAPAWPGSGLSGPDAMPTVKSGAGAFAPGSGLMPGTVPSGIAVPPPPSAVVLPPLSRPYLLIAAVSAALLALAAIGLGLWWFTRSPTSTAPAAEIKHTQVTFIGNVRGIAFSPDGRTAAYATAGDNSGVVNVRDVAGGQALPIWKGELVIQMQWTPDGSNVVVSGIQGDQQGIWVVPRLGGTARRLPVRGAAIAISPDGQQLARASRATRNQQGVRISPLAGGEDRVIEMDGFQWLLGLDWGRKTNRIAVLTQAEDGSSTIWTIAPDGSDRRRVYDGRNLASVRWSPIADVLYAIRSRNESAEVIRLSDRAQSGEPDVLLTGLPWDSSDPYQVHSSLSTDGVRLLYVRGFAYANLWRLPAEGPPVPASVTSGTSRYGRPRISPDGQWIATSLGTSEKSAIVKIPFGGGEAVPVTSGEVADSEPAWSRDGKQIAFRSIRSDGARIWVVDPDVRSTMDIKDSRTETEGTISIDWFPDGRALWALPGSTNYAIRDLRTGTEETLLPKTLSKPSGWLFDLRVSPNGQRLAAWWHREIDGSDFQGLVLIDWPSRAPKALLKGDLYPAGWSRDSQWIYAYELMLRKIVKVSASTGKSQPVGEFPLGAVEGCDVAPDGKNVICSVRETKSDAWLVENFDQRPSK